MDEYRPGWREDANALVATTVTPLAAGFGLHIGNHGFGALGVALDIEPEEFVRRLPGVGRRARLLALREAGDLNVPGTRAGSLLDEAGRWLGMAALWSHEPRGDAGPRAEALRQADLALADLEGRAGGDLTEGGRLLAVEMRAEWTSRTHERSVPPWPNPLS
ncbi:hypothetical protein ACQEWB_15520 [Streptomyces sp. CA-249302]|uniref:hypothetical protein n=1 Tax=Streptomyces sp. CA-249302 TaxID=3240058 RepID=UPI003D900DD4